MAPTCLLAPLHSLDSKGPVESFFSLTLQALLCNSDFFNQFHLIFLFFFNMLVLAFASLEVLLTCTAIRDPDSGSLQNFRRSDHRRLLSTFGLLLLIIKITTTWAGDAGKLSSNLHTPHLRTSSQTCIKKMTQTEARMPEIEEQFLTNEPSCFSSAFCRCVWSDGGGGCTTL